MGKGNEGWATTGAATDSSTIIASANPPVKHMPSAPTPAPPSSSWSERANERSQSATGEVAPTLSLLNSLLTHTRLVTERIVPTDIAAPGGPNRCGMTTVNPRSTTSSANVITLGVIPGISWITMTPGPDPLR